MITTQLPPILGDAASCRKEQHSTRIKKTTIENIPSQLTTRQYTRIIGTYRGFLTEDVLVYKGRMRMQRALWFSFAILAKSLIDSRQSKDEQMMYMARGPLRPRGVYNSVVGTWEVALIGCTKLVEVRDRLPFDMNMVMCLEVLVETA
jgi:hypothetical protein